MRADEPRDRLLSALATAEFAYTHALATCCDAVCKPMVDAQKTLAPAAFKMRDVRVLPNSTCILSVHVGFLFDFFELRLVL